MSESVAEAGSGPPEPVKSIEEDAKPAEPANQVTEEQWKAMMDVVMGIYDYREEDGHDPSRLFHRSVNKRYVPDYYEVIKEPMALSLLKQKINKKTYKSFSEFVRDCALIPHNAQTYNRPKSQAYEDALVIRGVFATELKKLVDQGLITSEVAEFPDLGEIPEADPLPAEEEEEEEEDEEDEEPDDSDEEDGRRKKKRGPRPGAAAAKRRDSKAKEDAQKATDPELRKKRGRPPRVDTPMEARIKAVLKGIRKLKDSDGLKVRHFERLPDKSVYPDYFQEIKEPMAIDLIKRKSKRKKYNSVDHFMKDVDTMFNNAKSYNQADSQLYRDAIDLQTEAHRLAELEKKKPDSEYLMEDGRFPLPNGILHNGELWKVGDWVHIQNPNDATKPIVAQIYRTWQDVDGQQWVNACWYYRPEQTVHQYEKHFYPNEVVKTGQYRDHQIEEVVDRCFVMFFTRYNRGRPRGLLQDKEVYVCEARYNEEKHKLNKIKTWASCLPDEVREKDYEMDLFEAPRKIKKIPSPIRHLLKDDAKETDDIPKPTWGAENAPPIVGAVHRRPREENDSPPPEPTPSPPPIPAPQSMAPARQLSMSRPPTRQSMDSQGDISMGGTPSHAPLAMPSPMAQSQLPAARLQPTYRQPAAPVYQTNYPAQPNSYAPPMQQPAPYHHQPPPLGHMYPGPSPNANLAYQQPARAQPQPAPMVPAAVPANAYNPNAPRPVEVYHLSDAANTAIPADIREQFHHDDQGRVLFFTAPPLDPVAPTGQQGLAHSAKFLEAKKDRLRRIAEKKRAEQIQSQEQESRVKRARIEAFEREKREMEGLERDTLIALTNHIQNGTDEFYNFHFGDRAREVQAEEEEIARQKREEYWKKRREDEEYAESICNQPEPMRWDGRTADGVFLDDIDPRL